MSTYSKAVAAVVAAVLVAVQPLLGHGWDLQSWLTVAVAAAGAVAVYIVPNLPGGIGHYAKFAVAALTAGAESALQFTGPITGQEWVTIGLAVLGALGVVVVPNKPPVTPPPASAGPVVGPPAAA